MSIWWQENRTYKNTVNSKTRKKIHENYCYHKMMGRGNVCIILWTHYFYIKALFAPAIGKRIFPEFQLPCQITFILGGIHIIGRLRHKCSVYGSKGQALNCQNALQKAKLHFPCEIPPGPSNFVACTHMFVVLGHITATRRQVLSSVRPIYCHCSVITGFTSNHSITHCLSLSLRRQGSSYFQTMSNT